MTNARLFGRMMKVAMVLAASGCEGGGDTGVAGDDGLGCRQDGIYRDGEQLIDFGHTMSPARMGFSGWSQSAENREGEELYDCTILGYTGSSYRAECDGESCAFPGASGSSGGDSGGSGDDDDAAADGCDLSCSAGYDSISVGLSCGTSSRSCRNSWNSFGQLSGLSCSYSNGRSFSCHLSYNGLGQPSGSCSGEGDSCRF